jgi:hypothetical protein
MTASPLQSGQSIIDKRHENMYTSSLPTATKYCSIHGKLFMGSLQAWCTLQSGYVPSPGGKSTLIEAPCDECMRLARRTFKAQFPNLYNPRT